MPETVSIDGLTLCHRNSTGFVRATLPDVCKTPPQPAPVPYTNLAYAATLAGGTTTVLSHGGAMNGILGSRFATSVGNEPGVAGGVVSGVNMAEATFLSFSSTVFMQGRPVTRLTDKMLLNKGNTVALGGYYTGPVPATPLLEEICTVACECKALDKANQACVDLALAAIHAPTNTPDDGVFPEARYKLQNGTWTLDRDPATGMPNRGGAFRRPDVTRLANGKVAELVEVKFKNNGDRYRGNQRDIYDDIAADNGVNHTTLNFPDDCKCDDPPPVPATKPAEAEEPEGESAGQWLQEQIQAHPVATGVIIVGAAVVAGLLAGPAVLALVFA